MATTLLHRTERYLGHSEPCLEQMRTMKNACCEKVAGLTCRGGAVHHSHAFQGLGMVVQGIAVQGMEQDMGKRGTMRGRPGRR